MAIDSEPGSIAGAVRRLRISPARALLLLGPILFFGGYAIHPDLPNETVPALREVADMRGVYIASKVMVAFGSLLMIPLLLTVRHVAIPNRGRSLATVAVTLGSIGFACNALSQSLWGYLLYFASDPSVDTSAGAAVIEAGNNADILPTLPVSFFSVPLFAVGLLLFAVALWRAATTPRWAAVVLVLADLAAPVFPVGPMNLVTGALVTAAFAVALNPARPAARHGKLAGWSSLQPR